MNDYAHMSVDELFCEYAHWSRNEVGTHWEIQGEKGVTVLDRNPLYDVARKHAIIAAIRERVVKEASIGIGEIGRHWVGEDEGGRFTQVVRTENEAGEEEDIEEGLYDLIPRKETP